MKVIHLALKHSLSIVLMPAKSLSSSTEAIPITPPMQTLGKCKMKNYKNGCKLIIKLVPLNNMKNKTCITSSPKRSFYTLG
ncbi:hypothetical protein C1646_706252 [Rhizophagus diaphanus]|nr:hypothetical protein C1646_706252 [Rhizophagus diaphanus] [Rhizophagus sp. MUCL 43196]